MWQNAARSHKDYISEYTDLTNNRNNTFYDVKKLAKEDQEKLGVVTIDGSSYITNLNEHKKQNDIAIKNIKVQRIKVEQKKKKSKTTKASGKKEINIEPRETGSREYVYTWLGNIILQTMGKIDHNEPIFDRLVMWCAFNMPVDVRKYEWEDGDEIDPRFAHAETTGKQNQINNAAVSSIGLYSLRCFLTIDPPNLEDEIDLIVKRAVEFCDLKHRCYLAKHLGIEIEREFRVDDDYLKLYTKDGLIELAKTAGLDKEEGWTGVKSKTNSELRKYLVGQKGDISCPTHVTELIDQQVQDYNQEIDESLADIKQATEITEKKIKSK